MIPGFPKVRLREATLVPLIPLVSCQICRGFRQLEPGGFAPYPFRVDVHGARRGGGQVPEGSHHPADETTGIPGETSV